MKTFIQLDVQNLFFSAKDIKKRIDFLKIKESLYSTEKDILDIYAYIIRTPDANSEKFENFLKSLGYILNIKKAHISTDESGKRIYTGTDQDMSICIDCMKNINLFDKWILMSGDGDFIDLCKYLKEQGKYVEVWSMPGISFNKKFCDYADVIRFLEPKFFYDKDSSPKKDSICEAQV